MLPFISIYFEANALRDGGYPRFNTGMDNVLDLARHFAVPVVIPEPVQRELEEQWLRELMTAAADYHRAARSLIPELKILSKDEARKLYRNAVDGSLGLRGVKTCPSSERPVAEVFEMSVTRSHAFKEGKDKHFQDVCIYLSIIDHMMKAGTKKAALVSEDFVFQSDRLGGIATMAGVEIVAYKTLRDLNAVLTESLTEVIRTEIEREREVVRAGLNLRLDDIRQHIIENYRVMPAIFETINEIRGIEDLKVEYVGLPLEIDDKPFSFNFDVTFNLVMLVNQMVEATRTPLKIGQRHEISAQEAISNFTGSFREAAVKKPRTVTIDAIGEIKKGIFHLTQLQLVRDKVDFLQALGAMGLGISSTPTVLSGK